MKTNDEDYSAPELIPGNRFVGNDYSSAGGKYSKLRGEPSEKTDSASIPEGAPPRTPAPKRTLSRVPKNPVEFYNLPRVIPNHHE